MSAAAGPGDLVVRDLKVRYGKTEVLRGASFEVRRGEVVALLGANGCGKSTALNAVSGFVRPSGGSVLFDRVDLARLPTHAVFAHGVVQVSQRRDLFPRPDRGRQRSTRLARSPARSQRAERLEAMFALFPRLAEKRGMKAQVLSGGEQQMIAMARALVSRPRLVLLDEPSGGLAPKVVDEIGQLLSRLKDDGVTMLLVEQNIHLATTAADRF
jgi:branched-chain amino acid transport system ATP-binding protein